MAAKWQIVVLFLYNSGHYLKAEKTQVSAQSI